MCESCDEYGAGGPAKGVGGGLAVDPRLELVPAVGARPGEWSRAVVQAADAEGIRAALRGPAGESWAAERLTQALGQPLPYGRPRVTALRGRPPRPRRPARLPRR